MNEDRLTYTIEVAKARLELEDRRTFDCIEPLTMTLMGAAKKYSIADFISPIQGQVPPESQRVQVSKIVVKAKIQAGPDFDLGLGVLAIYQADYVIWSRAIGAIIEEYLDVGRTESGDEVQDTIEMELHLFPRVS